MRFRLEPATDGVHKYIGVFTDGDKEKRISFGAKGYKDFTQHHDPLRRERYLDRHRTRENWRDPMTAGALSRWILWNTQSIATNVRRFKQRFGFT